MKNNSFIDIRRQLHQIPEIGFAEFKTQAFLLQYLSTLTQERMVIKTWKTGILVRIPGRNPKRCIGYRTDMDGLPISEETGLPFQSHHSGYMHACGHDLHMAIALGVLTHFVDHPVQDDLIFIFQPAEEGPGGALPLLESREFQEWRPDMIFALHIAPEYPVGSIAIKPGILFANTSELFIDLTGKGGHAAFPHHANDMVIAAAHLATQLQSIISRNINPLDSAVITIGKITGGTKQNVIAEKSRLEGTIRTLSMDSMKKVKSRIEALVHGIETGFECRAEIDYGSNYCQVYNNEDLTKEFINWVNEEKVAELIKCQEAMTGEDFGYLLREIPGFMFWLGTESPFGLHHSKIQPGEGAIPIAIQLLTRYLTKKANE
ncbi:MAG TPA: N-acetyldiaminopimelate deacetylase [Paenibacillaceae bacterium]|nr:N-acetyldiaminopimelate deacetylase [Paenibacillaceae bacterium]